MAECGLLITCLMASVNEVQTYVTYMVVTLPGKCLEVLEFASDFQCPGKSHRSWKVLEIKPFSPGKSWNSSVLKII
jgi:hypothetical protein